ncbi:hypothetical protein PR202_ga12184 [Eleusine coracana subsp. coracana]|uniref:Uncharacterized protein n=1 Tax=Eleusine coracana subsp. coracana TaxID=191504 RepID=A0AAV5CBL9_ELECO|nr:hypothetical protein PR202_ga12184 [Eleusine coracana subsp. coracana]
MGSSSKVVRPEDVLESLKNDGTIDAIRMKIIAQLKANIEVWQDLSNIAFSLVLMEDMKKNTMMMVEQSKVLNTPGAEKKTKRELFDALRQELETPVLEKASKAVWELILDKGGLGKEITETVEKVFCRLGGVDMMPPAPPAAGPRQLKDDMAIDDGEKSTATDPSSSKKRPFSDMSRKGAGAVTNGGGTDQHESSEDGN